MRNEIDLIFNSTKAAWRHLRERGGGAIINTASISAYSGRTSLGAGAHAAAKGAVISYTRQLAAEGAPHRIRVNSISPGGVDSPALAALPPEKRTQLDKRFPLGRIGQPRDIAWCALYLASDEAEWVTGSDFVIDGGANTIKP
jgi:NAD(P)-dependent dehydrogenase (short-subunit alcohol dehydrogenase family)